MYLFWEKSINFWDFLFLNDFLLIKKRIFRKIIYFVENWNCLAFLLVESERGSFVQFDTSEEIPLYFFFF